MTARHLRWFACGACVVLVAATFARAQTDAAQAVKATFLARFASFVTWPGGPQARPVVCVQGEPALASAMSQAAGSDPVQARGVQLVRTASIGPNHGCDILFAGGSSTQTIGETLALARGRPTLTVTDSARGPSRGMIHFVVFEGRVRFHIDAAAASQAGLKIDSRVLALALTVKQ